MKGIDHDDEDLRQACFSVTNIVGGDAEWTESNTCLMGHPQTNFWCAEEDYDNEEDPLHTIDGDPI